MYRHTYTDAPPEPCKSEDAPLADGNRMAKLKLMDHCSSLLTFPTIIHVEYFAFMCTTDKLLAL